MPPSGVLAFAATSQKGGTVRRISIAIVIASIIVGCGGGDAGSTQGGSDTTSPGATATTAPNTETTAPTSAGSTQPTNAASGEACALLSDGDLAVAFPDGAPTGSPSTGTQNESICHWGESETVFLDVIVWPGVQYYSDCDACTQTDLGDGGWLDHSSVFSTALVLVDGNTLQVIATGLGMEDEADLATLVAAAVDRS